MVVEATATVLRDNVNVTRDMMETAAVKVSSDHNNVEVKLECHKFEVHYINFHFQFLTERILTVLLCRCVSTALLWPGRLQ